MKNFARFCSLFVSVGVLLLIGGTVRSQDTTIYYQSFDSSANLPIGWSTNGWVMDTSNTSAGSYDGASGLNNIVVKNSFATGIYELQTGPISSLNYHHLNVTWAARLTKNFEIPGSYVQGFYMSTDSAATWDSIPYTENPQGSSSPWLVDNGASDILLPSSADHKASVQFKWVVNIVNNAQGTYRIDDFKVSGIKDTVATPIDTTTTPIDTTTTPVDTNTTGINDQTLKSNVLVYVSNNSSCVNVIAKDRMNEPYSIEVFNVLGDLVRKLKMVSTITVIDASELRSGVYLVRITQGNNSTATKIVLTN